MLRKQKSNDKRKYGRTYRHTLSGLIRDIHDKMRGRCVRGCSTTPYLYVGKFLPSAETFRAFALKSIKLRNLYNKWKRVDYDLKSRPTPDRINPKKGYELSNIRFMTYSENSSLARRGKKRSVK